MRFALLDVVDRDPALASEIAAAPLLKNAPRSRLKNELMLELWVPPSNEGIPITSPEVLENPRYGRWR